jgi:hypothetical protein
LYRYGKGLATQRKQMKEQKVEAERHVRVGLARFTLFSPELGLWVCTFHHVLLQSKHQLMTAAGVVHGHQSDTRE